MDKLREFFNENNVRVGEGKDFTVTPPVYYASLMDAFLNYYSTFRNKRLNFGFLPGIKNWKTANLSFDYTGADESIVFTILGFHRFFELLLKDVLRRINPFLAVKMFEKEDEVFEFIDNRLNPDNVKTIEYGETVKRFKQAYKHYENSEVYEKHLKPYEFLISPQNSESLSYLAEWRNRIMHNGTTFPNLIAFEYLISQRIIPIIKLVLDAEKPLLDKYDPHYLTSSTGINILDQILGVKFDFMEFSDQKKAYDLAIKILKLQHIKEFGRAASIQLPYLRKNRDFYEHLYENPIGRSERFAASEQQNRSDIFYNLIKCNCCGTKSKVVYRMEYSDLWTDEVKFNTWFKCFHCDYSFLHGTGDPHDFGLADAPIFPVK
jgi:hypothetical protein